MDDGFQVWGPCPLCEAWCLTVFWEDFIDTNFHEWQYESGEPLFYFTHWDVEDAIEDAMYQHLEDEHGPYWREDLPPMRDYDPQVAMRNRRRRRVETVDLLRRLPSEDD